MERSTNRARLRFLQLGLLFSLGTWFLLSLDTITFTGFGVSFGDEEGVRTDVGEENAGEEQEDGKLDDDAEAVEREARLVADLCLLAVTRCL